MFQEFSVLISLIALAISAATAWFTLFQRGTVCMTQPSAIFLGHDGRLQDDLPIAAKVYLRSLLYSTSKRGRIVESMFVLLRRAGTNQAFSIWVYGEPALVRGSGLFVGEVGVTANHHFLLPADGTTFNFLPGDYVLEVHAKLVGDSSPIKLFSTLLTISQEQAEQLKEANAGIFFDWRPESNSYHSHIDKKPLTLAQVLPLWGNLFRAEHPNN